MITETKRWATFWAPGLFVGENWQVDIASMDPYAIAWPDNAYAVVLCERDDIVDGETRYRGDVKGDKELIWYYHPDSNVETLEQVKLNPKATRTLIANMECNRWDRIIWTRWGTWPQPFDPARMVVLEKRPT